MLTHPPSTHPSTLPQSALHRGLQPPPPPPHRRPPPQVVAVANEHFDKSMPSSTAYMYANLSFFAGVLLMALVNRLVHTIFVASARSGERAAVYFGTGSRPASPEHDAAAIHAVAQIEDKQRLLAMAAVVSAAIVLHNIPEGSP